MQEESAGVSRGVGRWRASRQLTRRLVEFALVGAMAGTAVYTAWQFFEGEQPSFWLVVILVLLNVPVLVAHVWATGREPVRDGEEMGVQVPRGAGVSGHAVHSATFLALEVAVPGRCFSRIKESVRPLTRAHQVETEYWARAIFDEGEDYALIPVLVPNKGTLMDDFSIRYGDGSEVETLSYSEYVTLVAAVLESVARLCGRKAHGNYVSDVSDRLLDKIASRAPVTESERIHTAQLLGEVQGLLGKSPAAKLFVVTAMKLVSRYAIIAKVPLERGLITELDENAWSSSDAGRPRRLSVYLRTTHRQILEKKPAPLAANSASSTASMTVMLARAVTYAAAFLYGLLGIRSNRFDYPLEQAGRTGSYHLHLMGPSGTYLIRQGFPTRFTGQNMAYHRFRARLGQRYGHLYVRGGHTILVERKVTFAFQERPPGTLGRSALASLALFVGVYAAGVVSESPAQGRGGDVVAALLALLGLAAGLSGLDRNGDYYGGSALGRLGFYAVGLLSALSIVLFFGKTPPVLGVDVLGLHSQWGSLLGVTAIVAVVLVTSWIRMTLVHAHFSSRRTGDEE